MCIHSRHAIHPDERNNKSKKGKTTEACKIHEEEETSSCMEYAWNFLVQVGRQLILDGKNPREIKAEDVDNLQLDPNARHENRENHDKSHGMVSFGGLTKTLSPAWCEVKRDPNSPIMKSLRAKVEEDKKRLIAATTGRNTPTQEPDEGKAEAQVDGHDDAGQRGLFMPHSTKPNQGDQKEHPQVDCGKPSMDWDHSQQLKPFLQVDSIKHDWVCSPPQLSGEHQWHQINGPRKDGLNEQSLPCLVGQDPEKEVAQMRSSRGSWQSGDSINFRPQETPQYQGEPLIHPTHLYGNMAAPHMDVPPAVHDDLKWMSFQVADPRLTPDQINRFVWELGPPTCKPLIHKRCEVPALRDDLMSMGSQVVDPRLNPDDIEKFDWKLDPADSDMVFCAANQSVSR